MKPSTRIFTRNRLMKHTIIPIILLFLCTTCHKPEKPIASLWYDCPATSWDEALPIGNGRLGAMIYGNPDNEIWQLNDNTLYSGEPATAWKGLDITETYDQVVLMLRAEKYAEASDFLLKNWMGCLHQNYQPLGEWHLENHIKGEITDYKRELDISKAVHCVSYKQNRIKYVCETFASYPDNVIVARLRSDAKDGLDVTVSLSSVHPSAQKISLDGLVSLSGQAPGYAERRTLEQIEQWGFQSKHPELFRPDGSRKFDKQVLYGDEIDGMGTFFETRIKAVAPGAQMTSDEKGLRISGTDEIVFILSSATSFNGFDKSPSREGVNVAEIADSIVHKAVAQKYDQLKARHIKDFRSLYDRVDFRLPVAPEQSALPVDERIRRYTDMQDNGLITLLFQYGRYLMISGSRPCGQPLNLQGMWNDMVIPPWNGAYTMNINTEMNYWPAEPTNLSECHQPLLQMIQEIAASGSETAEKMYRRKGWVGHHNVSIWRETYPNDGNPSASYWPLLSPWLCSHLWEHYLFTCDETFLRDEAYPLMKSASEFLVDWLVDNGEGYLVTPVSTSPENVFLTKEGKRASVSMGCTMDMSMIRELFSRTIEASEKLDVDADYRSILQEKLSKLLPYRIGSKGQLQEWQRDFEEADPQHRHLSHLYGLYPGNQINYESAPELMQAAARTLELRGDESTGWSSAWKINLRARLLDGDRANDLIRKMIVPAGPEGPRYRSGLQPNMLNTHPPFQIDGNFGFTAGVTEILLQSHAGYIQLLPALPSEWLDGKITGLKARGGFTINMEWADGKLIRAEIISAFGGNCRLRTSDEAVVNVSAKEAIGDNPNPFFKTVDPGKPQNIGNVVSEKRSNKTFHTIDFMTEKGKTYRISAK